MFTRKDLKLIDRGYFRVISAGCFGVTLQSRNILHCWYISSEELGSHRSCKIYHTHHEGTAMHEHGHGRTIDACMEQIRSHDSYQLAKDARKRRAAHSRRRQHTIMEADSLTTTF